MTTLDIAIREEYQRLAIPADQIVSDPRNADVFCKAVNDHLNEQQQVDQATLNRPLLNLRRRGETNGGLPRLQRNCHGHGATG